MMLRLIPLEAIKKAIEGGWEPFLTRKATNMLLNVNSQYLLDGKTMAKRSLADIALDPSFWQCLGKALGKEKQFVWEAEHTCPLCANDKHTQFEWWNWHSHRFTSLILTSSDTKAFWEELLTSNNK